LPETPTLGHGNNRARLELFRVLLIISRYYFDVEYYNRLISISCKRLIPVGFLNNAGIQRTILVDKSY